MSEQHGGLERAREGGEREAQDQDKLDLDELEQGVCDVWRKEDEQSELCESTASSLVCSAKGMVASGNPQLRGATTWHRQRHLQHFFGAEDVKWELERGCHSARTHLVR